MNEINFKNFKNQNFGNESYKSLFTQSASRSQNQIKVRSSGQSREMVSEPIRSEIASATGELKTMQQAALTKPSLIQQNNAYIARCATGLPAGSSLAILYMNGFNRYSGFSHNKRQFVSELVAGLFDEIRGLVGKPSVKDNEKSDEALRDRAARLEEWTQRDARAKRMLEGTFGMASLERGIPLPERKSVNNMSTQSEDQEKAYLVTKFLEDAKKFTYSIVKASGLDDKSQVINALLDLCVGQLAKGESILGYSFESMHSAFGIVFLSMMYGMRGGLIPIFYLNNALYFLFQDSSSAQKPLYLLVAHLRGTSEPGRVDNSKDMLQMLQVMLLGGSKRKKDILNRESDDDGYLTSEDRELISALGDSYSADEGGNKKRSLDISDDDEGFEEEGEEE